jgi:hypothetical protein
MVRVALRPNRPKVISESFEDEVVAINLETGTYFGMAGAAKEIWRLIEGEVPEDSLLDCLTERYDVSSGQIAAEVEAFIGSLVEQDLVSRVPENSSRPAANPVQPLSAWEPPRLAVYDDMKDLLLLDPIHDVDESGWPARKPEIVE